MIDQILNFLSEHFILTLIGVTLVPRVLYEIWCFFKHGHKYDGTYEYDEEEQNTAATIDFPYKPDIGGNESLFDNGRNYFGDK